MGIEFILVTLILFVKLIITCDVNIINIYLENYLRLIFFAKNKENHI